MKRKISIHIGGIHVGREPTIIETLVGSCVAVCLWDEVEQVGGMNHIFLPGKADLEHFDTMARYGINAMELLINRIMARGGSRRNLIAKAFGGAHVLPAISRENGIGSKNSEFVLNFLHMEAIPLVSQDLGGCDTRRIYFHTDTGEVFLKRVPSAIGSSITIQERKLLDRVRKEAEEAGEITWFA